MQAIHSTTTRQGRGPSPLLAELQAIYEVLDDQALIERLRQYRWTGRPGYSVEALWRSYLAGFVLNLGSTNALVRRLQDDPPLAELCGFSELPSRWTFNRFVIRLSQHLELVEQVFRSATKEVAEHLKGAFGYMMAVDASVVHTHSNPTKKRVCDAGASWTAKGWKVKGGKDWYFGYKLHLVADADTELPIPAIVTTAKVNDTTQLLPLLAKARSELGLKPSFVLADAGYDSNSNVDGIAHEYSARPIIKIRAPKRHHLKGYRPLRIKIDQKSSSGGRLTVTVSQSSGCFHG